MMTRDKHPHATATIGDTGLPGGASIERIAYVSERSDEQQVFLELPPAIGRRAIRVPDNMGFPSTAGTFTVTLLLLPGETSGAEQREHGSNHANRFSEDDTLRIARMWIESESDDGATSQLMMLQGTRLVWGDRGLALIAAPERWDSLRAAILEVWYYEAELRDIERSIGENWPQMEQDLSLAFEFNEQAIGRRKELQQRFQQTMLLRARMARIATHVHAPHVHPATLASQINERLRERMRMAHRHEYLDEQVEVYEGVYEQCAERSSNFMLTRSGNILEWVIIILLLTQILLWGFDILTGLSDDATTTETTTSAVTEG